MIVMMQHLDLVTAALLDFGFSTSDNRELDFTLDFLDGVRADRGDTLSPIATFVYDSIFTGASNPVFLIPAGERIAAVWDHEFDGKGVNPVLGPQGDRLFFAYSCLKAESVVSRFPGYYKALRKAFDGENMVLSIQLEENMTKSITVKISPDGQTVVSAAGFEGNTCLAATEEFLQRLGTVTSNESASGDNLAEVKVVSHA